MTNPVFSPDAPISDEMLVAYLDGALSAEDRARVDRELAENEDIQARLGSLDIGDLALDEAFGELLTEAPLERLERGLETAVAETVDREHAPQQPGSRSGPTWGALAASVLLAISLGIGGGAYLQPVIQPAAPPPAPGWRATVASYVALFTPQSHKAFDRRPLEQDAALDRLSTRFGVPLTRDTLQAPGLALQQAQLLRFKAKPLAQIAYLHESDVPVALCLIPSANPDTDPQQETRNGLSVVHWVKNGIGYMLIGELGFDVLEPMASQLERQLG